eukprot:3112804-Ditylum_brightwellii.AAC.1
MVNWSHQVLGHLGCDHLRYTLETHYHHYLLCRTMDSHTCKVCQRNKISGKGYSLVLEREMQTAPWEEVAIDSIGPWKIKGKGKIFK